jgi:uncharacterized repeat protein (TIGR02543 family)
VETSFLRYVYLYSDDLLTDSETIYTTRPYQLSVPSKTGYTFIGWFDSPDGGTQYTNGEGVSLSVCPDSPSGKLYAHWSLNYYTITYDCEQNVNTDDMPVGYTVEDEDFILNSQSPREHYNFYWSVLGTKVESFDTSIAQDVVVKGVWDPINYTITYNLDGGTANNRTTYNIEGIRIDIAPKAFHKNAKDLLSELNVKFKKNAKSLNKFIDEYLNDAKIRDWFHINRKATFKDILAYKLLLNDVNDEEHN